MPVLGLVPILALLMASSNAWAEYIPGYPDNLEAAYDPREMALLPRYCKFTQLFRQHFRADPAEVAHWGKVMGPAFQAMHHYCWGLMKTNRAMLLATTRQTRTFYLNSSIDEFNYVIRSSPPDFVMLPEILTKKGENLLWLGRTRSGIAELERAIKLKSDYWPPYAALSDHFKKTGNAGKAREWLVKALAFAPDTPALKTRLQELDSVKR